MAQSTSGGITYPDQSDAVDVAADMARLAMTTQGAINAATLDTGWLSMNWTWGNGYAPADGGYNGLSVVAYRRIGKLVMVQGGVKHSNTDAAVLPAFNIPSPLRPTRKYLISQTDAVREIWTDGNVYMSLGVSTFTYISLMWALG